jgi:predicted small lipoprotein YifL
MKKIFFSTFLFLLVFAACGKKGPLVLEPENPPPTVENFQVRQIGAQIELSWKFPGSLAGQKGPFETAWVTKVYVYHAMLKPDDTPTADNFIKKAVLLAKPKAAEIKGLGQGSPSYRVWFKNKELQGKRHGFILVYYYGRQKSLASPLQTLLTLNTPPAVQDLQISRQGKMVILNWSKPVNPEKDLSLRPVIGYRIYRRIIAADGDLDFRPIGPERTINEFYHDLDTGTDGEYEYQVSCRLDEKVENAPSNTVRIKVLDTFPPDIPGNLVTFTAKDQVFLTWENVPDVDLAFYRLYRKSPENEDFKLLAEGITENFYRDKKVSGGKLYVYAISAVDKKGNESELSGPVQQLFE